MGNGISLSKCILFIGVGCLGLNMLACKSELKSSNSYQLVKTCKVEEWEGALSVNYPGRIKAAEEVKLSFRVAGPLKKVYVGEGERVRKGQLLAEIDPRDYRLQYESTQAEYNQVVGETNRIIELYKRGSVSINEYDKAVAAKERITSLYHVHRNALNDTKLYAPFDGYIQNKYFVAPEIVSQGLPVLAMLDDQYFEVNVDIPATDYVRKEDFEHSYIVVDVFPDVVLPLELVDVVKGANYNQLFKVRFHLKRSALPGIAAGMSALVTIDFAKDSNKHWMVPISALFTEKGHSYVWIYREQDSTVLKKEVEIERFDKSGQVWVNGDLERGEVIVSAGVNDLKEGQKVKQLNPVSASNIGGLL